MKDMKNIDDRRLVLLETLIRYADETGDEKPRFYKDEMMKRLGVCDHVFNKIQKQIGDRCCRKIDTFEERTTYAINVGRCMELHNRITQELKEKMHREGIEKTVLATLIGTFLVLLVFIV